MSAVLFRFLALFFGVYLLVLALLYFFQERLLFVPSKLDEGFKFEFNAKFEEINLSVDGAVLNGLHFYASKPKGAVLFFTAMQARLKAGANLASFTLGSDMIFMFLTTEVTAKVAAR